MSDIGIFWIRDDFRIENNPALSFATQNHENVIALFIYNNKNFDHQTEAQKWWVSKSLGIFKTDLSKYNINLQIIKGDELDVFSKIKKKDNLTVYWNKVYEPDVIDKGKKIRDVFIKNEIITWFDALRIYDMTGLDVLAKELNSALFGLGRIRRFKRTNSSPIPSAKSLHKLRLSRLPFIAWSWSPF